MTYFNLLFQYGIENLSEILLIRRSKAIIPDLPHEHANFVEPFLANTDIALILLVSMTTELSVKTH